MARTEGQWQKGISLITPSENVPILLRNEYLNFGGDLIGETGYGFRDNAGVMQVKNSGGSWANFGAGGGGSISDAVYGVGWNGDTATAPSKNALYDKIETLLSSDNIDGGSSDDSYLAAQLIDGGTA